MIYTITNKASGEKLGEITAPTLLTKTEVLALLGIPTDSPNGPHISDYEVVVRK